MSSPFSPARVVALFVLLGPVLMLAGCGGSKTGTISGKVLYKGKPLEGGFVNFLSDGPNQTQKGSGIQKDGSYSISNFPIGPSKITVQGVKARRLLLPAQFQPEQGKAAEAAKTEQAEVYVPPVYENAETTTLTHEVKAGKQERNLELE